MYCNRSSSSLKLVEISFERQKRSHQKEESLLSVVIVQMEPDAIAAITDGVDLIFRKQIRKDSRFGCYQMEPDAIAEDELVD